VIATSKHVQKHGAKTVLDKDWLDAPIAMNFVLLEFGNLPGNVPEDFSRGKGKNINAYEYADGSMKVV